MTSSLRILMLDRDRAFSKWKKLKFFRLREDFITLIIQGQFLEWDVCGESFCRPIHEGKMRCLYYISRRIQQLLCFCVHSRFVGGSRSNPTWHTPEQATDPHSYRGGRVSGRHQKEVSRSWWYIISYWIFRSFSWTTLSTGRSHQVSSLILQNVVLWTYWRNPAYI